MGAMKAQLDGTEECPECGGIGIVPIYDGNAIVDDETCPKCGGEKRVPE